MIKDLDISFKNFLVGEAAAGSELSKATISFSVPDSNWRNNSSGLALNVYLFKLLEHRELRQNARSAVHNPDGTVSQQQWPTRLECSYLITGWNLSQELGGEEREKQEHRLLSQVLYVLFRNPTMPAKYLSGLLANTQEIDLPIIAARSDDMGSADSDFWIGLSTPLRPSVVCKVTLSVDLDQSVTEPMVTTARTAYTAGEERITIGGTVRAAASNAPVANAWVLLDAGRTISITAADGRYQIDDVRRGSHTLTVRAVGFVQSTRALIVPSPTGEYDMMLTL
jgi:hypothetical protein